MENDRIYAVTSKLDDYIKSPSLRHIRDPRSLQKLAKEIVQAIDRASSIWGKWEGPREELAKLAAPLGFRYTQVQPGSNLRSEFRKAV
jgi:hypothetical protein